MFSFASPLSVYLLIAHRLLSLTTFPTHQQSLKEIRKKINSGLYPGPQAFEADMHLMLANAMTYVRFCYSLWIH